MNQEETDNTLGMLKIMGISGIHKIFQLLSQESMTYSEMLKRMFGGHSRTGQLAYYIKLMESHHLLCLDGQTREYYLSFRGKKCLELYECCERVANLTMEKIDYVNERVKINLEKNQGWLQPLLRSEIRAAVRDLK